MSWLASDAELALDAARRAGTLVMRWFRSDPVVRHKSPGQPVTEADLAADAMLRELLTASRPDYGWMSEETADHPDRLSRQRVWVVDPIDGTRSFIAGSPEFAISVGLALDGVPMLGVVLNPAAGEVYWAIRGAGAWRAPVSGGSAQPIRVRTSSAPRVLVASKTEIRRGELEPVLDALPAPREWNLLGLGSTAWKLACVAGGGADAFLSRGPKSEWDVCAGALLVEMAGGTVTDAAGRPFRFNRLHSSVNGVLATTGGSHDSLVSAMDAAGPLSRPVRPKS